MEENRRARAHGHPFPEDYGGTNGGTLAYCLAVEEISRICGSTGLTLAAHVSLGTFPIYKWGNQRLRDLYVRKLIAGEYMGAYGLTEPGAGSDAGATRTTAVKKGEEYVLNGASASTSGTGTRSSSRRHASGSRRRASAFVVPDAGLPSKARSSGCAGRTGQASFSRTHPGTCSDRRAKDLRAFSVNAAGGSICALGSVAQRHAYDVA